MQVLFLGYSEEKPDNMGEDKNIVMKPVISDTRQQEATRIGKLSKDLKLIKPMKLT